MRLAMRYSGPAGMTEQDDMEAGTTLLRPAGVIARHILWCEMGLGLAYPDYGVPG